MWSSYEIEAISKTLNTNDELDFIPSVMVDVINRFPTK